MGHLGFPLEFFAVRFLFILFLCSSWASPGHLWVFLRFYRFIFFCTDIWFIYIQKVVSADSFLLFLFILDFPSLGSLLHFLSYSVILISEDSFFLFYPFFLAKQPFLTITIPFLYLLSIRHTLSRAQYCLGAPLKYFVVVSNILYAFLLPLHEEH